LGGFNSGYVGFSISMCSPPPPPHSFVYRNKDSLKE
jgi:hypothetical protein